MISVFNPKTLRRDFIKQIVSCDSGLGRVVYVRAKGKEIEYFVELFDSNDIVKTDNVKKL